MQCPAGDSVEQWSDDRFWDTLKRQIPSAIANNLETGPSLENRCRFVVLSASHSLWETFYCG